MLIIPAAHASDAVNITFDGACNTLTLSSYQDSRSAILGGKKCPQGLGTGFTGSFKSGKSYGLGVRFLGDSAGYYLVLSTPIATGGTWTLSSYSVCKIRPRRAEPIRWPAIRMPARNRPPQSPATTLRQQ